MNSKSVGLPLKLAGNQSHRGFAFIGFITKQDAKVGLCKRRSFSVQFVLYVNREGESLSASTHLYGRRLVLEWAAGEDTVEDVRRRTTSHYAEGKSCK